MDHTIEQVAEAFSRHRFAEAYPYLLDDVRWNLIGDRKIVGRDDVVSTCEQSAEYLAGVTTRFGKFKVVVGDNCVAIDSEAEYSGGDDTSSVVASCDIYDFSDGRLSGITSYTVELGDSG